MASIIYNSCLEDEANGNIDFGSDTFKFMLVTSSYTPNKDTHTKRSDITNEVSGTGYTAGGVTATVTVTKDNTNDRVEMTLGGATIPTATITARGAVYYKSRGGLASADELIAYIDFNSDITSTAAPFLVNDSTFRKQNLT